MQTAILIADVHCILVTIDTDVILMQLYLLMVFVHTLNNMS